MLPPIDLLRWIALSCVTQLALCSHSLAQTSTDAATIDFSTQIRPILAAHCYSCHGPDENSRAAKLRLDVRDVAITQSAIVPNQPSRSHLVERIMSTDSDLQMPPPSSKKTLTEAQKTLLTQWIEQGAAYSNHWAFLPPAKSEVPEATSNWANNPIDNFVGKHLEQEKLKPSPKADRAALLRRVSLDLVGLPPTPAELNEFLERHIR